MVAPPVINFVDPVVKKIMSGMGPRSNNNEGRRMTCSQISCVTFGILNIIFSAFIIVSSFIIVGSGNGIFASWMTPWHRWGDDDGTVEISLTAHEKKPVQMNTLMGMILAVVGPYIIISKGFMFLGMSVTLICGIFKRSASTVKAFLIYTAVVLPMCLIVNIFYLVMIWLYEVTDYSVIWPHVAVLFFNLTFALELMLCNTAHRQLKTAAPYTPTKLDESEHTYIDSYKPNLNDV